MDMEIKVSGKKLPGEVFKNEDEECMTKSFVPEYGVRYTCIAPVVLGKHAIKVGQTVTVTVKNAKSTFLMCT